MQNVNWPKVIQTAGGVATAVAGVVVGVQGNWAAGLPLIVGGLGALGIHLPLPTPPAK